MVCLSFFLAALLSMDRESQLGALPPEVSYLLRPQVHRFLAVFRYVAWHRSLTGLFYDVHDVSNQFLCIRGSDWATESIQIRYSSLHSSCVLCLVQFCHIPSPWPRWLSPLVLPNQQVEGYVLMITGYVIFNHPSSIDQWHQVAGCKGYVRDSTLVSWSPEGRGRTNIEDVESSSGRHFQHKTSTSRLWRKSPATIASPVTSRKKSSSSPSFSS